MIDPALKAIANRLTRQAKLGDIVNVQPVAGGGNNRVFRVDAEHGPALLKVYFRAAHDPRDRLGAETRFLQYAQHAGIDCVPQLLAWSEPDGVSLLEFVTASKPRPEQIDKTAIDRAMDFFVQLNAHRFSPAGLALPPASEARFSVVDHLGLIEGRIDRLSSVLAESPLHQEAKSFIDDRLVPRWRNWLQRTRPDRVEKPLAANERVVSPSDFGFHNALFELPDRWRFIDFEYAGWDDPSKTLVDFFCQPAVPVPHEFWRHCKERIQSCVANDAGFEARVDLLQTLCRVRWCCIVLNAFHPHDGQRRRFAEPIQDVELQRRLARAMSILDSIVDF